MDDVLITGIGIVSPIGIGTDAVRQSIANRTSGVTAIDDLAQAGWLAPYGGQVVDFDPKEYVKPRKSMKVMAREIQMAFAAAELAATDAGAEPGTFDPDRSGVVLGAGTMYCDVEELADAYRACATEDGFDFSKWGQEAARQMFPLWMLKYLPNMPACHIGIRQDARGPNNTIAHGDVSSLLALAEATHVIRRGQADVMFAGGISSRLAISDLLWHGGVRLAQSESPPETISRPFDVDRSGMVVGEGSALFVLESRAHAERRGATAIARVASVASRNQNDTRRHEAPAEAISTAFALALERAGLGPEDLSHVHAHGASTVEDDPVEAAAIAQVLDGADVPVTAAKSFFGNLGAGGGAVELAVSLLAAREGQVPPTINHSQTDPNCPVRVATDAQPAEQKAFAKLNHTSMGQAVAAIVVVE